MNKTPLCRTTTAAQKKFKKWNASKALMTGKGGTAHCLFEHIPL